MNRTRWVRAVGLVAVGGALAYGSASAQTPGVTIDVDEDCRGTSVSSGGTIAIPCALLPDLVQGGLPSAVTYTLSSSQLLTPGDVILLEPGGGISDVIRFNQLLESPGLDQISSLATLVFYSDNSDGVDALADTGFPTAFYANVVSIPELGPEGHNGATYTPIEGEPGFFFGLAVTYNIHSDRTPEPTTLALLGIGIAGLGLSRRQRKR